MLGNGYTFAYYPKTVIHDRTELFNHLQDEVICDTKPHNAIYLTPIHRCNGNNEDESVGVWLESKKNSTQFVAEIRNRDALFCQVSPMRMKTLRLPNEYLRFNQMYGKSIEGNTLLDWKTVQGVFTSLYLIDPPITYDWTRFYEGLNTVVLWSEENINAGIYFNNLRTPTRSGEATFNSTSTWKVGAIRD